MPVSNPLDVQPLLLRTAELQDAYRRLTRSVEQIATWKVLFVHPELHSIARERAQLDRQVDHVHRDMTALMSQVAIALPAAMTSASAAVGMQMSTQLIELVQASRGSAQCVLAVQRLQDASSALGALVERKYAYAFAFIAMYVGLAATIFSTWFSISR